MASTTADRNTPASYLQRQNHVPLAASAVVPAGVICAVDGSGNIPNGGCADTNGLIVVGRSEHAASQAAGDVTMNTSRGVYGFAASTALIALGQAMVGRTVYVVDNQTVGLASDTVNEVVAGTLEEIEAGVYYVSLGLGNTAAGSGAAGGINVATVADGGVSPALLDGGIEVVFPIAIPDAATATYSYKTSDKIEIIGVEVLKAGAGAANTVQLTDGADAAISDAIAAAVDKAHTRDATLDAAKRILAAGATFKLVCTRAAGTMAALVLVRAIKRA